MVVCQGQLKGKFMSNNWIIGIINFNTLRIKGGVRNEIVINSALSVVESTFSIEWFPLLVGMQGLQVHVHL